MTKPTLIRFLLVTALSWYYTASVAQTPWKEKGRGASAGTFIGKVVDEKTGRGIEFAAVQLMQVRHDTAAGGMRNMLVAGQLTKANGDFSLDNLSVRGEYTLKISSLGYKPYEQKISFNLKKPEKEGDPFDVSALRKDLGNIKLLPSSVQLSEVTIDGSTPAFEIKLDKKVYNVEKNPVSAGGTAEDVLKNIPSVSVDIDNNVSLRNAAPQIFVDGRPTTLSIDQIPADAIQEVEVITNPSAKYDASGGGGGILNIVMKKNRKMGYNGSVRAGVDSRGRMNGGGDLNIREGKINFFLSGHLNQRKSQQTGHTSRLNLTGSPNTLVIQDNISTTKGLFRTGKAGFDFFADNRNTFTLSGSYTQGRFKPKETMTTQTDTLYAVPAGSLADRIANNNHEFKNMAGSLAYKHLFPKEGMEWTADMSYSNNNSDNTNFYWTQNYFYDRSPYGTPINQKQQSGNTTLLYTAQTDFSSPAGKKGKIETGVRAAYRTYTSTNTNFIFNAGTGLYEMLSAQTSDYAFTDQVYAGYMTYSNQLNKFAYQFGLRAESSFYTGEQTGTGQTFKNTYPVDFFPSAFFSYKLNEKNDLQLNYTRRINRPSYYQLVPYTDYTDSLNLNRGNPALKPEFTNSAELSWQRTFNKKNNFLASLYLKNSTDLITRYQLFEYNQVLAKNALVSTYENANYSYAYGLEITVQNNIATRLDLTSNVNLYNSVINGKNIEQSMNREQFTWFAKMNANIKLPKEFSVQLAGNYRSKMSLVTNNDSRPWAHASSPASSAQGYVKPSWAVDASVKYAFLKNKDATLSLSVSDIFKTKITDTHSESPYFVQDSLRKRDQQFFRFNFSYRFGKFDASLFKRKHTPENSDNPDVGG